MNQIGVKIINSKQEVKLRQRDNNNRSKENKYYKIVIWEHEYFSIDNHSLRAEQGQGVRPLHIGKQRKGL